MVLLTCGLLVAAWTSKAFVGVIGPGANGSGNGDAASGNGNGAGNGSNGGASATHALSPETFDLGILLGGDVLLDLQPGQILRAEGPTALMRGWAELRWLGDIDLGLANLECPLSTRGEPLPGKLFTFRGHPEEACEGLRWLGFDGVSLANNHIQDYGVNALIDTLAVLEHYRIASAGAGRDIARAMQPAVFERDGIRIAFLAFGGTEYMPPQYQEWWGATEDSPGIAPLAPADRLLEAVRAAKADSDLVILSLHWGIEYADVTRQQRALGMAAIDAGADIVFGHHPHVPQPVEIHRGRPIIYSLGNLVFHPFQEQARHMMAAEVRVGIGDDGKPAPVSVRLHPLYNDAGRTIRTPDYLATGFLETMAQRCRALGTGCTIEGGSLAIPLR